MNRDPGLGGSRTEFGHGPFTATRPGSAERGASLVDQQGTVLRLLIQLSTSSRRGASSIGVLRDPGGLSISWSSSVRVSTLLSNAWVRSMCEPHSCDIECHRAFSCCELKEERTLQAAASAPTIDQAHTGNASMVDSLT
jgi:hypothetical protein